MPALRLLWFCAIGFCLSTHLRLQAEESALLFRPPRSESLRALERIRLESLEPARARFDPRSGRAGSLEGRFPLRGAAGAAAACLEFLAREPDLFGWDPALELRPDSEGQGIGTEHLRFQAYLDGIPVSGSRVDFHLEAPADGGSPVLIYLRARLPPEALRPAAPPGFRPRLSAAEAVEAALRAVNPRALRSQPHERLEVLPSPAPGRLTYRVHLPALEPRGLFSVRVDAESGEVISTGDLLRFAPPASRDGTGKVFLTNPIVALRDRTLRDDDDSASAVPAAAYVQVPLRDLDQRGVLSGPYVTTEFTPHAVRRVRLDFSLLRDHDGFEEVMIYYHLDSMQRFIQSLGFKDIYHRQISAYANSEPPGIPYTDSQAYYQPDPENPGTGELAFGSGGADAAEDAEVIGHEYGHALQDNQVPGFGSDFENLETFALGEGWADWVSAVYLSDQSGGYGDDCLGEWVALWLLVEPEDPPECFRRLDSTKHYPEDLTGEPHDDGEMWSSSLWRVFKLLGREDSLKLVFQSNFFLSTDATFEEAAQAVIRADGQLFGGKNRDFLQGVFSDRGFLASPLDLTWFLVVKHTPQARIPPDGGVFISKSRLVQPGVIPSGARPFEVYLNLVHPYPGAVEVTLRSPSGTSLSLNVAGSRFLPGRPVIYGRTLDPWDPLAGLAGDAISGVWSLRLENLYPESGFLVEWGLRFQRFLRGDPNQDGKLDLSDGILLLRYLFLGGEVSCPKAGDFDDNGSLSVSDAVGLLRYVVGLGPPPTEPFAEPGSDSTADALACGDLGGGEG